MVLTDFYFSCSRNAVAQCSCNNVYDSEKCRTNLHVTQGTFMGLMCSLVKTFRLMLREFWCFTLWRIHELQEREKKNELLDRDKQIEREINTERKRQKRKACKINIRIWYFTLATQPFSLFLSPLSFSFLPRSKTNMSVALLSLHENPVCRKEIYVRHTHTYIQLHVGFVRIRLRMYHSCCQLS